MAASVQGALEDAIEKLSGARVTVITGAGLHRCRQRTWLWPGGAFRPGKTVFEPGKVQGAFNHYLKPAPVVVLDAAVADDAFLCAFLGHQTSLSLSHLGSRSPPG